MIDSMIAPVVADEGFGTERLFQDDFPILGKWFRRCGRIVSSEPGRAIAAAEWIIGRTFQPPCHPGSRIQLRVRPVG
jgi:hypothetical protein